MSGTSRLFALLLLPLLGFPLGTVQGQDKTGKKSEKPRLVLVSTKNLFLEAFLETDEAKGLVQVEDLLPQVVGKDAYRKAIRDAALVVFDRCRPEEEADLPKANCVFIDRPPPPWKRGAELKDFPLKSAAKEHPVLGAFKLDNASVAVGFRFDPKADLPDKLKGKRDVPTVTPVLTGPDDVPVVFTLKRGAYTDLVLTFPLVLESDKFNSNWPLQPSFPLFWRSVVTELSKPVKDKE